MDDFQSQLNAVAAIEVVPTALQVIHAMTGMGFIAVASVTPERWVACAVLDTIGFGLEAGGELVVETTICHEIRQNHREVVIDNVANSPIWSVHHTPLQYGFQSYISVPIILADGSFFGTLCAIDPKPAELDNPRVTGMFKLFADLIARHLDVHRKVIRVERQLEEEIEAAHLRDQFIGILGHDIRNPIASISAGTKLLRPSVTDKRGTDILNLMEQSVMRVSKIVDNVLDYARGVSHGMMLRNEPGAIGKTLTAVVDEMRQLHPERSVEHALLFERQHDVDHNRIAQLFSNLLSNAYTHGDPAAAIRIGGFEVEEGFELWVANGGKAIPADRIAHLFHPFKRGGGAEGLGLGLFIASEIAKAHGGELTVTSDDTETRFTLRVPATAAGIARAAE